MRKALLLIIILFGLHFSSKAQFTVTDLSVSGPFINRIDFVILPDGFTQSQLPGFIQSATNIKDTFFNTSPYKEYKNFYNVVAIEVPSTESGADHPANATDVVEPIIPYADVNNYFGSSFDGMGIHRALVVTDQMALISVLSNNYPFFDQVLMLVNSPEYGGAGGGMVATSSMHAQSIHIALHEWGHTLGGLKDEYWPGTAFAGEAPNMTQNSDPNTITWHNWLNVNGVGINQHYSTSGPEPWYKPHTSCKMEDLTSSYCSVCKDAIISAIYQAVSPIDLAMPDTILTHSYTGNPLNFTVSLVKPEPFTLTIKWELNGSILPGTDTSIQITGGQLNGGMNVLKAIITDTTNLSRSYWPAAGYQFAATWNIYKSPTGIIQVNNEKNENRFFYKVFPVPAADKVIVEFQNYTPDKTAVCNIVDVNGRVVKKTDLDISGVQRATIDISDLAVGNYILTIKSDNINVESKLVKF